MNLLVEELAKLLSITIEKAIEIYPTIQKQFIVYEILSNISPIGTMLLITGISGLVVTGILWIMNIDEEYGFEVRAVKSCKKVMPKMIIVTISGIVILLITSILTYLLAPDFMMIKEFILR